MQDISLSVEKGKALAIIGTNGSGKSTLLKMLSGIIEPDTGSIGIYGKIACLIELGAGFHPDMTGRENIDLCASIYGLSNKEIKEKMNDIIEFSEIGEHIDKRVRYYSSGMYLRLAFSIAINVSADILIIDEILAVGDIAFQNKCLQKIKSLKKSGCTIVFVTHSIYQATELCDSAVWIYHGKIRLKGSTKLVCAEYDRFMINGEEI